MGMFDAGTVAFQELCRLPSAHNESQNLQLGPKNRSSPWEPSLGHGVWNLHLRGLSLASEAKTKTTKGESRGTGIQGRKGFFAKRETLQLPECTDVTYRCLQDRNWS